MANDTMSNLPPLTFFRGLVVELDGEQRDTVDLATTALGPIADAARVFALADKKLEPAQTLARLHCASVAFPAHAAVFHQAAHAFHIAAFHQAWAMFRRQEGERLIRPSALGKYDQRLLKTAFDAIQRLLDLCATTFGAVV
jgi:CBS domain-containing protein